MRVRMIKRPENVYEKYHAHVYFDQDTLDAATKICTRAGGLFGVTVGRVHQKNVGPHPRWSCQLSFDASQFDDLIAFLEDNRDGMTVLVHALTGNDLDDHTVHAAWLGEPVDLNLAMFQKGNHTG
jgi:aromatic ring-cleaving dioxygenase